MRPRTGIGLIVALLVPLTGSAPSQAELIQFTFSGELTEVIGEVPAPWDAAAVGSPFAVSYVFDSETPDLVPGNPFFGAYDIITLGVEIDGVALMASNPGVVEVNLTSPVLHEYRVFFDGLSIGPFGAAGDIDLVDLHESFESDDLPTSLDLEQFEIRHFELGLVGQGFLYGQISRLDINVVPTCSVLSAFAMSLGLNLLGIRRRRGG